MIPIFISEGASIITLLKILGIKILIGMIAGFVIDFVLRLRKKDSEEERIIDLCEKEHCHCEKGILKSALKHTINIFVFILIITFVINIIIHLVGEETIGNFVQSNVILGPVLGGIIGLIPNCASSVILTQLYLQNVIPISTMISGLLVGAGVGLIVLFKMNKGIKQNLKITALLYIIGVLSGVIIQILGIQF